jgi:hypothetical protein
MFLHLFFIWRPWFVILVWFGRRVWVGVVAPDTGFLAAGAGKLNDGECRLFLDDSHLRRRLIYVSAVWCGGGISEAELVSAFDIDVTTFEDSSDCLWHFLGLSFL